ncbi:MAG: nucleoside triphosphatase YtkD [Caldibacillus sp.]
MYCFRDVFGNEVKLSFSVNTFERPPEHVLVICRYNGFWLLTDHKERGLEFPGGKMEGDETPEEAAVREVMEETGAEIERIVLIGQYQVTGGDRSFVKNVYFANIKRIREQKQYFETNGPVLLDGSIEFANLDETFSYIMKDGVLQKCLEEIKRRGFF